MTLPALILAAKTGGLLHTIGAEVIISSITTTTKNISGIINFVSNNAPVLGNDVITILKDIDLEFTISIIEQVISEKKDDKLPPAIHHALMGVSEILEIIHEDLCSFNKAIEEHNEKYFAGWRGFVWEKTPDIFSTHNGILEHRYKILVDLLKIQK